MQLLEMVGLKEEYEDVLWSYLNTTVSQTVTDYQVDTKEKNMLMCSPVASLTLLSFLVVDEKVLAKVTFRNAISQVSMALKCLKQWPMQAQVQIANTYY